MTLPLLPGLSALGVRPEKDEYHDSIEFYRKIGCVCWGTWQARRSKIALGLPDIFVAWPQRERHWVHETKKADGVMSDEQMEFRRDWIAGGGLHLVGTFKDAVAFIEWLRGLRDEAPDPTRYFPRPKRQKKESTE